MSSRPECNKCGERITVGGCSCKEEPTFGKPDKDVMLHVKASNGIGDVLTLQNAIDDTLNSKL